MNNDENDKPADKVDETAEKPALRPRRIVKSASTQRAEAEAAASKAAAEATSPAPANAPPPSLPEATMRSGAAPGVAHAPAPTKDAPDRRVFDARAPKPAPRPSPSPPAAAWDPTEGAARRTGPIDASSRAPGALPRPEIRRGPIDASSRAPGALPRPEAGGPRHGRPGDRPDRPARSGSPFEPRGERSDRGARGDRGPRFDGPRNGRPAPRSDAQAPPRAEAPRVPPPKPSQPTAKPVHKPPPMPLPFARNVVAPKSAKPALTAKEALAAKSKAKAGHQAVAPKSKPPEPTKSVSSKAIPEELVSAGWETARDAVARAGDGAEALIDRWLAASNGPAISAIVEADDVAGATRKAARRALGVLKSRGVVIPERPRVARFVDTGPAIFEATFLPPDASGTSAITVACREANGRYHIAEVIVRESVGILHAGTAWLSGSQLKDSRARAEGAVGVPPVAIPVEWARHRISAAKLQNATSRHVMPINFDACRELIEPVPASEPTHPIADLEQQVTSEVASARAPGSATLHEEAEFRGWMPDQGALAEMLQKVGERLGSQGVQEPDKFNDVLQEEMAAATDRFFSPELRGTIASRMRDAAISLRARKGDERALDALAIARAVKEAGLITSPPREIPFLVAFFQKAIGYLARQGGGQLRIPVPAAPEAPAGA